MMIPTLVLIVGALALLALQFGPPLLAANTDDPGDEVVIRAEYEGLQGRAGPCKRVASITRTGTWYGGGRGTRTCRVYKIVIERVDGEQATRTIGVTVGDRTIRDQP